MSSYLEKKGERRTVVPQRAFYSDAIANAPLVEEDLANFKGAATENKLSWQVLTEVYSPIIPKHQAPPRPVLEFNQEVWDVAEEVAPVSEQFDEGCVAIFV